MRDGAHLLGEPASPRATTTPRTPTHRHELLTSTLNAHAPPPGVARLVPVAVRLGAPRMVSPGSSRGSRRTPSSPVTSKPSSIGATPRVGHPRHERGDQLEGSVRRDRDCARRPRPTLPRGQRVEHDGRAPRPARRLAIRAAPPRARTLPGRRPLGVAGHHRGGVGCGTAHSPARLFDQIWNAHRTAQLGAGVVLRRAASTHVARSSSSPRMTASEPGRAGRPARRTARSESAADAIEVALGA